MTISVPAPTPSNPAPPADPTTPPVEPTQPTDPAAPPATGEQLGEAGLRALQAERARAAKAEADLRALQQSIDDSQKTAEQKAADAASEAATARLEALRWQVAATKGLDPILAARLTGSTKEELEADADALMALIPPKAPEATPPAPPAGPTVPGQQPGGMTPALITQADLDALGAAGKYEEINRLRREGRLTHLGVAPPKG